MSTQTVLILIFIPQMTFRQRWNVGLWIGKDKKGGGANRMVYKRRLQDV
jgi:hypothetical protein